MLHVWLENKNVNERNLTGHLCKILGADGKSSRMDKLFIQKEKKDREEEWLGGRGEGKTEDEKFKMLLSVFPVSNC